jgi:hypothetical protein
LVKRVDSNHVVRNTESEVSLNVPGAVHECGNGVHKVGDLGRGTLGASREVLASEFGDPDRLIECVVIVLNMSDERFRVGAIPMDSNGINMATAAAVKEVPQPGLAIWCRRDGGRDKTITTTLQRFQILTPKCGSISRVNGSLASVIRLIKA